VLGVLLVAHESSPAHASYLRGLVGLELATKGGLSRLAAGLPTRKQKLLAAPPLREAMRTSVERFEARMTSAYRNAIKA
jgi:hypothetical protein